jgi:hypothetical protein
VPLSSSSIRKTVQAYLERHPGERDAKLEWAASSRSPYREMDHLVHTLARRPERGRS